MFTRNKKNYRTFIYAAIVITLCLLVVALAWPQEVPEEKPYGQQDAVITNNDPGTEDDDGEDENGVSDDEDNEIDQNDQPVDNQLDEENNMSQSGQSYYLVKRAGDQIVVYFCDDSGNTVQLETTQILYELLGPDDQALFDEGIKVESQEELGVLLQDFES